MQPTSKTPDRKSSLKTVTKKGITVNPKKEDLMKETFKRSIQTSLDSLKEAAKKNAKAKKGKVKRWWDDDGDGIGYEPHEVKKTNEHHETDAEGNVIPHDDEKDAEVKSVIKERMRQRMISLTQAHDAQQAGLEPTEYKKL
ncbi:hypothetical protein [Nonlabens xiamenensis]|uniref:hypothetical protein n=1 Tax=Nonlabens xiamenensis TaxID=2341043 RepID=UPI0013DDC49E|nr:hypothetical protein [Nonlabens xiamenensis]|tara:strand:+ start:9756 stop:10178 length:423 start_codon:yes stop_codon:yes gene_type:complete